MQAVVITKSGDPEVLKIQTVETPTPRRNELLIKVHACGINRADLLQRMGKYPPPPGAAADILGLEFAGEVVQLGTEVQRWQIGDRVCGILPGGAYAEYVVTSSTLVSAIPSNLSYQQAAAIPEAYLTAYDALVSQARLTPGETVLIQAVGSGVGIAALQLAKAFGAHVIGTSRSQAKLKKALALGLDHALAVENCLFSQSVLELTDQKGADVVLELVGGRYIAEDIACMALKGRLILIGFIEGSQADINWAKVAQKRLQIYGTVMRTRAIPEKEVLTRTLEKEILPLFEKGLLKPVIDKIFPFKEASKAHTYVEENSNFGKVVLVWS